LGRFFGNGQGRVHAHSVSSSSTRETVLSFDSG
jgi:hypothetical protein